MRICLMILCGWFLLGACTPAAKKVEALAEVAPAKSDYAERTLRDGDLLIGDQPSAIDLHALKATGTRAIVNLRLPSEMQTLNFDEAALAAELGLDYQALPVGGGEHPYTPELLAAFARTMDQHQGQVLLHCAFGGRAGHLYAAWLVRYQGQSPLQALRSIEPLGAWPLPMERLLGQELVVEVADGGKRQP